MRGEPRLHDSRDQPTRRAPPPPTDGRYARAVHEQDAEFTLHDARASLAALRDLAPDGLRLPLSRGDVRAMLGAGIEIKNDETGLIDFPTTIDGVAAYWCWQVGEPEIEWWHPRATGFAGRRPIAS